MKSIRSEIARIENLNNRQEKDLDKKTILRQLHKPYQKLLTSPGALVIVSEEDMRLRCAMEKFIQEKERIENQVLPNCKPAQKTLIKYILGKWTTVAYWHFYSDIERWNFYPFYIPVFRSWCQQEVNKLFIKKEVANLSLCLLIPSALHRGPNGYERYSQVFTEQFLSEIERVLMPLDPNAPTLKETAINALQWLSDYEAWLIYGHTPGQPDTHTASGQMFWDVVPLAERDKKLSYVKFWFTAQRAYWRFLKAGNGIINVQADGDKLLKNWRNQLITWFPPVKSESKSGSA